MESELSVDTNGWDKCSGPCPQAPARADTLPEARAGMLTHGPGLVGGVRGCLQGGSRMRAWNQLQAPDPLKELPDRPKGGGPSGS